jgi:hypothetical protein
MIKDFLLIQWIIYTNPFILVGFIGLFVTGLIERRHDLWLRQ